MPKIDEIISNVIEAEGGSKVTNDPKDAGGRTQYGIAEKSNPKAWADGQVTEKEAREIYLQKYVVWPRFHTIPPSHARLQEQLIDYGVNSGPQLATMKLQALLGVTVDGSFGPKSLEALTLTDPRSINNKLVVERVKMVCKIVQKNPTQVKFLGGWISRAIDFLL